MSGRTALGWCALRDDHLYGRTDCSGPRMRFSGMSSRPALGWQEVCANRDGMPRKGSVDLPRMCANRTAMSTRTALDRYTMCAEPAAAVVPERPVLERAAVHAEMAAGATATTEGHPASEQTSTHPEAIRCAVVQTPSRSEAIPRRAETRCAVVTNPKPFRSNSTSCRDTLCRRTNLKPFRSNSTSCRDTLCRRTNVRSSPSNSTLCQDTLCRHNHRRSNHLRPNLHVIGPTVWSGNRCMPLVR